jgi:hypothetical protein
MWPRSFPVTAAGQSRTLTGFPLATAPTLVDAEPAANASLREPTSKDVHGTRDQNGCPGMRMARDLSLATLNVYPDPGLAARPPSWRRITGRHPSPPTGAP